MARTGGVAPRASGCARAFARVRAVIYPAPTGVPRPAAAPPGVPYAVGRGVGGSVPRNRLRRRLRAIVGELGPGLAPGAYLVGAGPEAAGRSHDELLALVRDAVADASGSGRT